MLGLALLVAAGVFVEGVLRRSVSPFSAAVIAGLTALSVTVEDWAAVALSAAVFLVVIAFSRLTRTRSVLLAASLSVFAAALALASPLLVDGLAHIAPLGGQVAAAVVVSACMVVAFGMAVAMSRDGSLLPFAVVGAAALPVAYLPAAVVWGLAGLFFVARPSTGRAAAPVVAVAAVAMGAGLFFLPWPLGPMEVTGI